VWTNIAANWVWTKISESNLAEGRVVLKADSFSGYRWSDSGAGSVSKKIALGRKGLPLINTVGTDL
jgi:hypothetical protein